MMKEFVILLVELESIILYSIKENSVDIFQQEITLSVLHLNLKCPGSRALGPDIILKNMFYLFSCEYNL